MSRPGVLPPLTPAQKKAQAGVELLVDDEGRTAILLAETKTEARFIPMDSAGCYVTYTSPTVLRRRFPYSHTRLEVPGTPKALVNSSVTSAARCYVSHALYAGASEEVVTELERLVPITKEEKERIMAVKKTAPVDPKAKAVAKKPPKVNKKAAPAKTDKPTKAAKPDGEKKVSAASTFRELIMQGKLDDDAIFAEVQKRHPDVSADKRKYVAWYRNQLKKEGENPPAKK